MKNPPASYSVFVGTSDAQQQTEVLEYGDFYFFYRPKVGSEQVKSIDDVRRFFMVTSPEGRENRVYRLFLIGKKSLPEIRKSEARASERYWARVGSVFEDPSKLTKELVSDEFRKGDAARPVGEGKYAIVKHQNHAELAYIQAGSSCFITLKIFPCIEFVVRMVIVALLLLVTAEVINLEVYDFILGTGS